LEEEEEDNLEDLLDDLWLEREVESTRKPSSSSSQGEVFVD